MIHYEWNLIKSRDLGITEAQDKSKTEKSDKKWLKDFKASPFKWVYLYKNKQWYYAKLGHNTAFKKMKKEDFTGGTSKFSTLEDDEPVKHFDWGKYAKQNKP